MNRISRKKTTTNLFATENSCGTRLKYYTQSGCLTHLHLRMRIYFYFQLCCHAIIINIIVFRVLGHAFHFIHSILRIVTVRKSHTVITKYDSMNVKYFLFTTFFSRFVHQNVNHISSLFNSIVCCCCRQHLVTALWQLSMLNDHCYCCCYCLLFNAPVCLQVFYLLYVCQSVSQSISSSNSIGQW